MSGGGFGVLAGSSGGGGFSIFVAGGGGLFRVGGKMCMHLAGQIVPLHAGLQFFCVLCCASSRLEFVALFLASLDFACVHEMLAMHTEMGVGVACSVTELFVFYIGQGCEIKLAMRALYYNFRKMRFDQECDAALVMYLHVDNCLKVVFFVCWEHFKCRRRWRLADIDFVFER